MLGYPIQHLSSLAAMGAGLTIKYKLKYESYLQQIQLLQCGNGLIAWFALMHKIKTHTLGNMEWIKVRLIKLGSLSYGAVMLQ